MSGILESIDAKLDILLRRTAGMEPIPKPDPGPTPSPGPGPAPDPGPGPSPTPQPTHPPAPPAIDWSPTPGMRTILSIGASANVHNIASWARQFDSGRRALAGVVKRFRVRLLGYHGTPEGRRNWIYLVRDGESEPADTLLKVDISARNQWDAESTIGGHVQCKPLLPAPAYFDRWVSIDATP